MDAGGARTQSHHHTGPRRVAQRRLRMSVGKERSPGGQFVDVWGLNQRVPAHAANPVVLIVDRDEENIRFVSV